MAIDFKDYYATLGVSRDATPDQIKAAFRKLARQYHPDVAKDKKTAEEKFKEVNEANEVLSDPVKRKKYDELGANWQNEGAAPPPPHWRGGTRRPAAAAGGPEFHFGGTGFSDFFEQFFSGGTRYGFPGGNAEADGGDTGGDFPPRRGGDVEGDILVTLEEAMHGTVRPISLQIVNAETGAAETHSFKVRIPPGATDGRRIRVPEQGEPGHGGAPAGDLYLRIRHAAHPEFHAREADIFHELEVAPWEAVLGAELLVRTLDGTLKLRLPPGTQNGQQLRVRHRGLPKGKSGERGDFHVIVTVRLPTELTAEERAAWEKLRATSRFDPRASAS